MPDKILFIIIDQLRADCLNGPLAKTIATPNLDALMKESVSFNRHYTTTVPCGPARASLLTGLYAMNHRSIQNGTPLDATHPTIATLMRHAGYDPLLFGYTDTSIDPKGLHKNDPDLRTEEGLAPGFSEIVRMRFQDNASWLGYLNEKGYDLPENYWQIFRPVSPDGKSEPAITDPALYTRQDSDTAFLTNQTLRELYARANQNWFSTVTYIRPHPPLVAPAPYNEMYAPDTIPKPVNVNSLEEQRSIHPFFRAYFSKPAIPYLYIGFGGRLDKITPDITDQLRAVYSGLVTEVDHHIGRLIQYLRDTGQYDDTLIIFTADHGEMLGDHHMWGKNTPYNAAFHIPLIIRDPRNRESAGVQINSYTESIDIAPTLLEWAHLPPAPGFNGKSLIPWLEGKTPANWRTHYFAEMDMGDDTHGIRFQREFGTTPPQSNMAILQDENYKLVYFNGNVPPLLFDIIADPDETANIASDPQNSEILTTMIRKMLDHRMSYAHHALSRMQLTPSGLSV